MPFYIGYTLKNTSSGKEEVLCIMRLKKNLLRAEVKGEWT